MSEPTYIFVYGRMMEGQPLDGLVADLRPTPASARGRLYVDTRGRPVLAIDPDGVDITGELRPLSDPGRLRVLDLVIDSPRCHRQIVQVSTRGRTVPAWAWVTTPAHTQGLRPLRAADWRALAPR